MPSPFALRLSVSIAVATFILIAVLGGATGAQQSASSIEASRPLRPWEFLPIIGQRAGLFGSESGRMEAWVYPLKIFRDFHLNFLVDGESLPAESLARTLIVHPESATLIYAGDSFSVRETLFVPVHEGGAVIVLDIETTQPLEVEAAFVNDLELEWPASLGGAFEDWDGQDRAFLLGEEQKKYVALIGSPTAENPSFAYHSNYSASAENSFRLGVTRKGRETKVVVIAASVQGRDAAQKIYRHLAAGYSDLLRESAEYYRNYLAQTVGLEIPDAALQRAYDWARVSELQGLVTNADLGTGLIAGYRTAGTSQRPGFAWFFGRDSLWTSFALNATGDYASARTALDFISRFQRADGKIPHEIAQAANIVPWFKDYPYPYASADATPLFVIAMNDYVTQSGDAAFAREKWDNLWRACQFLRATYDSQGLAQNIGVGHGWVEGGPLLPVKAEFYQSALGVEALRALANLARLTGKNDLSQQLAADFERTRPLLDDAFWQPDKKSYAFALGQDNQRIDEPSVLTTVPLWFGLAQSDRADAMINQLAEADHETDWGMRIISSHSAKYSASGYHFGSVWPLFTGWASVGEYRYHHELPAYSNLRANALMALDGSLGHVTEVLSGDYYQPLSTSSPHQIWSAAMVVSPMLRGLFGLQTDAENHKIIFAPHVPADWTSFAIHNVHLGAVSADFRFRKAPDGIELETTRTGTGDCWVEFSPAFSLRAEIVSVALNGRPLAFQIRQNANDQHVAIRFPVNGGSSTVLFRIKNDFGLSLSNPLPPLGAGSRAMRVVSESWNSAHTQLTLDIAGIPGGQYELGVWNPSQITSVEGGTLVQSATAQGKVRIEFPDGPGASYSHRSVVFNFGKL
jgi:glycogen debranching enzyme